MLEPTTDKRTKEDLDREVFNALQKHKAGQLAKAFATYTDVLRVMPQHAEALHYMGLLAQQSGKGERRQKSLFSVRWKSNPANAGRA